LALKKSIKAKLTITKIREGKLNLKYGPMINEIKAKNKLRNRGISTTAKGINILKFSSNVRELTIQEIPLRKNPKPKAKPNMKKFFLYDLFL
tara:strand:- start:85 stop:360 length:276 start_codon:yes stop_codon:yes gene_type:complete